MDDAMLLPASDSSLAWVYEGATPAMTPDEAATAIRAATIGWTQDDHLQMGALQHHLAVALCDDPERQAVCSAAAFMHVAAAGLKPGSLLGKGMDPKVLRPKLGTKPVRIGTTRSNKPIYNMFDHPAHTTFKTADHVDHIKAMEAYNKDRKMHKAGTDPKLSVVQHNGPKTPGGHAIHGAEHPSYAHPIYNHRAKAGINWGDEERVKHQTLKDFSHYSAADHDAAGAHHHALGVKQKAAGGEHFEAGLRSSGISAGHQLAASHLRGLQKIKENPGKSSEWHAVKMGGLGGGNHEHFEAHRAASLHLKNMGKSMSELLGKSGGFRQHSVGKTASGKSVYLTNHVNNSAYKNFSAGDHKDAASLYHAAAKRSAGTPDAGMHGVYMEQAKAHSAAYKTFGKKSMHKSEAVSILEDFLAKSGGVMSKAGTNILGKTSSGKQVYSADHHSYKGVHAISDHMRSASVASKTAITAHPNFSKQDHLDAARYHNSQAHEARSPGMAKLSQNASEAHLFAHGHMGKSLSKASGEGSRGGKIIGHLKNGKPVYASRAASHASHDLWTPSEHREAGALHNKLASQHANTFVQNMKNKGSVEEGVGAQRGKKKHQAFAESHFKAAESITARKQKASSAVDAHMAQRGMFKSDIMGMPVDLGDMQGSPIDGSYVDAMGGSHDLFMQQADLANCPTMWAPIATVPEN